MIQWNNLLVYVDDRPESLAALEKALEIARLFGGRILVLDTLSNLPNQAPLGVASQEDQGLAALVAIQRLEQLRERVRALAPNVPVRVRMTRGEPGSRVLEQLENGRHDLVVQAKSTLALSAGERSKSAVLKLFRTSEAPVLALSAKRAASPGKVVCAINLAQIEEFFLLARKQLASARALADLQGSELHVLGFVVPKGANPPTKATLFQDFLSKDESGARRLLSELVDLELAPACRLAVHLRSGDPREVFSRFARSEGANCWVLGAPPQRTAEGNLIAQIAEDLLLDQDCSVLLLRPDQPLHHFGRFSPMPERKQGQASPWLIAS